MILHAQSTNDSRLKFKAVTGAVGNGAALALISTKIMFFLSFATQRKI
jgi:hypothetical protein